MRIKNQQRTSVAEFRSSNNTGGLKKRIRSRPDDDLALAGDAIYDKSKRIVTVIDDEQMHAIRTQGIEPEEIPQSQNRENSSPKRHYFVIFEDPYGRCFDG